MRTIPKDTRNLILTTKSILDSLLAADPANGRRTLNELRTINRIAYCNMTGACDPTLSTLSKELGIPKSTLSTTIKRLILERVVEEIPDPEDARIKYLRFTQEAAERTVAWSDIHHSD